MADNDTPLKPKQMAQVFSGSLENSVIYHGLKITH